MTASFPALEIVKSNFQIPGIRDRLVTHCGRNAATEFAMN